MTYLEAISEIQKRSVDALKVVQAAQIASLQATRDLTAALIAPPLIGVPPLITAMVNLTRTIAFELLDQQIACAKSVTETLVAPVHALNPAAKAALALNGAAHHEALPRVTLQPALTAAPETIVAEPIDEAIIVEARQVADAVSIDAPIETDRAEAASLTSVAEAPAPVVASAEPLEAAALAAEAPAGVAEIAGVPLETAPVEAEVPATLDAIAGEPLESAALVAEAPAAIAEPAGEPLETAAPQAAVIEPAELQVDLPGPQSVTIAAEQTSDVPANTLPPPTILTSAAPQSRPKAAGKKSKSAAGPNNRAKSTRRPGK